MADMWSKRCGTSGRVASGDIGDHLPGVAWGSL